MKDYDEDGLTWMKGRAAELWGLGNRVIQRIMDHASECNKFASQGKSTVGEEKRIPWPVWEEVDDIWKEVGEKDFEAHWYKVILALAMSLASEKHEGKELAFSFLVIDYRLRRHC